MVTKYGGIFKVAVCGGPQSRYRLERELAMARSVALSQDMKLVLVLGEEINACRQARVWAEESGCGVHLVLPDQKDRNTKRKTRERNKRVLAARPELVVFCAGWSVGLKSVVIDAKEAGIPVRYLGRDEGEA
jgi:hypothetical protein